MSFLQIRATIHIHHGIFEHSGRYENIINFLTRHGYAVFMIDHEGLFFFFINTIETPFYNLLIRYFL